MFCIIFGFLCLSSQAHSYVLLQVRKDDQNRSNVDAIIHKVVPSGKFDNFARKIARKHFAENTMQDVQTTESKLSDPSSESKEKTAADAIKNLVKMKPVLRTSNFKIEPEVINFRSKPSLMYELDSNTLIRALKDFLSSDIVKKYTENVAKKAAYVYRSLTNDK